MLFLFLSLLFPTPALSVNPTNQYQADYLFQRSLYQQQYTNYKEKQQIHQKFSSVSTQRDLFNSAKQTSQSRNLTLRTYLTLLRTQLAQHQDQHPDTTFNLQNQLLEHESWLSDQNQQLVSATDADKINNINSQFNSEYFQIQKTLYSSLIQNQINTQTKALNLLQQLREDIQKTNQQIDPLWFTNLDNNSKSILPLLQKAYSLTQKKQYSHRFNNFYPTAQKELETSHSHLIQMQSTLKTIINKFF